MRWNNVPWCNGDGAMGMEKEREKLERECVRLITFGTVHTPTDYVSYYRHYYYCCVPGWMLNDAHIYRRADPNVGQM